MDPSAEKFKNGGDEMKRISLIAVLLFSVFASGQAWSGTQCTFNDPNDDCQDNGFPPCYQCNANNFCEPTDSLCDDGNPCTIDDCSDDPTIGCVYQTPVATGDTTLPAECYICEPTENGIDINNGVCDSGAGEDCQSDPDDCLIIGFTCDPDSPNPPLPAPGGFVDSITPPTDQITNCEIGITIVLDTTLSFETVACEDADRCTDNICSFVVTTPPQAFTPGQQGVCSNPPIGCERVSDGCCPAGCVGPGFGVDCPGSVQPVLDCDPDCWPVQSCGDSLVEAPETCDDLPSGNAGIDPSGQPVPNSACRDPGTQNECTYCGDGILDSPSEQCDGTDLGQCTTCSGNCTCGIIPPAGICIFGSGFGSGENAPVCGQCSLNKNAVEAPGTGALGVIALAILLTGLMFRRARG